MQFEWDAAKARTNACKHHIDFITAVRVFLDPHRIETYDTDHIGEEDRWKVIGMVYPAVLVVVYTVRGQNNEKIRIISVRKANAQERNAYYTLYA